MASHAASPSPSAQAPAGTAPVATPMPPATIAAMGPANISSSTRATSTTSTHDRRSCVKALRRTIVHTDARSSYGRVLATRPRLSASRVGMPARNFTRRATARSSIRASLTAANPPAPRRASWRTRLQPPAAEAMRDPARFAQRGGYSRKKNSTKGGMSSFSDGDWHRSRAMRLSRPVPPATAAATRPRSESGA